MSGGKRKPKYCQRDQRPHHNKGIYCSACLARNRRLYPWTTLPGPGRTKKGSKK